MGIYGTTTEAATVNGNTLTGWATPNATGNMNSFDYQALPNSCIKCPANTYQPLKAIAATSTAVTGPVSSCR